MKYISLLVLLFIVSSASSQELQWGPKNKKECHFSYPSSWIVARPADKSAIFKIMPPSGGQLSSANFVFEVAISDHSPAKYSDLGIRDLNGPQKTTKKFNIRYFGASAEGDSSIENASIKVVTVADSKYVAAFEITTGEVSVISEMADSPQVHQFTCQSSNDLPIDIFIDTCLKLTEKATLSKGYGSKNCKVNNNGAISYY